MSSWKDSLWKECLALRNITGWRGLAAKKYWAGMPSFSRGKKASSWGVMEFLSNLLGAVRMMLWLCLDFGLLLCRE